MRTFTKDVEVVGEPSLEKLEELWSLLFCDSRTLTDKQIGELLAAKDQLYERINTTLRQFPGQLEEIQRYRARKAELAVLTTCELSERLQGICCNPKYQLLELECTEDMDDNSFPDEPPPFFLDENIILELIEERCDPSHCPIAD